ncbi:type IV toxin-antitoxin system AbiEi family antitoxin domain-containing protein [uncultured Pseudokineococcus sp.]|uniref:type IV toxin-antitoxin system AbiEi family antitoxin domain-containing protein n=1 Tax=uncultured Pseudokineococcus sp. TaxID=1642928 RepID=UPI002617E4FE|nr:type IV toxin-antitoxin system AbiEi family antitoxin domain-containing protein [uncultured Pseudokineococcus sp.]
MDADVLRSMLAVAARQDAVVTVRDLEHAGASRSDARSLVRRGEWSPLLRGAWLVRPERVGARLLRSWARSAALTVPGAVVSHGTAAALHGLADVGEPAPLHVLVPPELRKRPRADLVVHHDVLHADEGVDLRGIPATSVLRTLVDLVPRLPRGDALALLDAALAQREVDRQGLVRARDLTRGRRGCRAVDDLWLLADGRAESPLESRARLDCVDGGVPPDDLQVLVQDGAGRIVARADIVFRRRRRPGRGLLVLEADGRRFHDAPEALLHDRHRANALVALGHDVIRCTWADTCTPGRVAAMVSAAL